MNCIFTKMIDKISPYRIELTAFILFFFNGILSVNIYQLNTVGDSALYEQWANLTNQLFYGTQDFLFSYGPLYFLHSGTVYSISSFWFAVIYQSIAIAFFWSLVLKLIDNSRSYILFGILFIVFIRTFDFAPIYFMWPLIVISYIEYIKKGNFANYVPLFLGAATAFFIYVRFFYGLIAILTLDAYLFSIIICRKKIKPLLFFILSFTICYLVGGVIIFHRMSSLFNYLIINKELSFGNSVDMTLDIKQSSSAFIFAFFMFFIINLFVIYKKQWRLLLPLNALWLVLFKLGFSRADHFYTYFILPSTLIIAIFLFEKSKFSKVIYLISFIILICSALHPIFPGTTRLTIFDRQPDLHQSYRDRMAALYPQFKLSDAIINKIGKNDVDIYPLNNEYAFANHLNYDYRPSFQNYMTLTPKLDEMNKAFFSSNKKPKYLLWTAVPLTCKECNPFNDLDDKYVWNEDPLTSTSILFNYKPILKSTGLNQLPVLLFEKRDTPIKEHDTLLQQKKLKFNEWYVLPLSHDGVLKIQPDFKFTLLGKLKNDLFRGNIIKIKYLFDDGRIITYRINTLNAKNGIWASPLLDEFQNNGFSGQTVQAIMFETNPKTYRYIHPDFTINLVKINIPNIISKKNYSNIPVDDKTLKSIYCGGSIDNVVNANNYITISGWLSFNKNTSSFDKVFLMYRDKSNNDKLIQAGKTLRKDVGSYFKNNRLDNSGYKLSFSKDILGHPLAPNIALVGEEQGQFYQCKNMNINLLH